MIEDLKADSARWENERRAQNSRHSSGGSFAPRDKGGPPARAASNSPIVSYHQSETHQSRQHYGPTETPHQPDPYASRPDGYDPKRAYPGSGAPGYSGSAPGYQPGPSQPQAHAYPGGGNYPGYQQSGQTPSSDTRYASPGGNPMMPPPQPGYQDPYVATGANIKTSRGYAPSSNDPYNARSSAAPQSSSYATSGQQQPGFPGPGYSYNQVPTSAAPGYASTMHPQDPFMGRGASKFHARPGITC